MISVLPKLAARTRDEQGMRIWALPVGLSRLLTPLVRASHIVCKRNLIVFGIEHLAFFAGRDRTIELDEWFSRPERMSCVPVIFNVEKKTAKFLTQDHESNGAKIGRRPSTS